MKHIVDFDNFNKNIIKEIKDYIHSEYHDSDIATELIDTLNAIDNIDDNPLRLSKSELVALLFYINEGYEYLNKKQYRDIKCIKDLVKILDNIIKKHGKKYKLLYRTCPLDNFDNIKVGDIVSFDKFLSTSDNLEQAIDFKENMDYDGRELIIIQLNNCFGFNTKDYMDNGYSEKEVILSRNTKLKLIEICNVENDIRYIFEKTE